LNYRSLLCSAHRSSHRANGRQSGPNLHMSDYIVGQVVNLRRIV
jgi:hypothetical protein